ncbi:hypothetical protein [Vibrio ouci]|uniref:Uncharacterized protein n=1 Tax=Vibrio ouci TaxID=2499078 RepID=A0A4Y8WLB9_9VIBR|nr:hypothetical protein [Vibrio ouci]TFH93415.1 hypothetical protein ELS82_00210 [Vibrio ouci]
MLSETIERVNRLRQEALADPAFIQSAKAHEKAIHSQDNQHASKSKSAKPRKDRTLADIYQQAEFGQREDTANH